MFARLVMIQTQTGKLDEAVRIYQESIAPLLKARHGFQRALLLTDPARDWLVVFGLWDSEDDLRAADADPAIQAGVVRFRSTFASPPTIEDYAVSAQF
jgi:quinol monooxygenase YgiN